MTLVDTNILLDVATKDPQWLSWSIMQFEAAAARGPVTASDIVYAEFSIRFSRIEEVDAFLADATVGIVPVPKAGLFLAGKAFRAYRARGGTRTSLLPDFLIGAPMPLPPGCRC